VDLIDVPVQDMLTQIYDFYLPGFVSLTNEFVINVV